MWTRDNLDVLRGLNSESIDLVYADPPFNSNKNYEAPIGSKAAGAAFKDTWTLSDVDLAWHGEIADREPRVYAAIDNAGIVHGPGMKSYLIMMAVRLLELRRVLKPTGSVYLHCDNTADSYLRVLCDAVFGRKQFKNALTWKRYPGRKNNAGSRFTRQCDTLLFYTAGAGATVFNPVYEPLSVEALREYKHVDEGGRKYRMARRGKGYESANAARRIYLDESPGAACGSLWSEKGLMLGQSSGERTGYPTQKPLALLDRIIKASSNPGDVVLDPFCGCATACVSAESLGRQWIGIDLSEVAARLVESRLREQFGIFAEIHHRTDIPRRTDLGDLPNYRTHKHTLYGNQEGHCGGCRMFFKFRNLEVDHVVPRAKGGSDHIDNLQLLCGACNRAKGTATQAELIAKLRERGQLAA